MASVKFIDLRDEIQSDVRGMSFFPWQGRLHEIRDLLKTFHLISIQPGYTRGNHLHPGHAGSKINVLSLSIVIAFEKPKM